MTTEVYLHSRENKGPPLWECRVLNGKEVIFDSLWVSLRIRSANAAQWLADLVIATYDRGLLRAAPGHRSSNDPFVEWTGDPSDDCAARLGPLHAHTEWSSGPHRGGDWYCMVRTTEDNATFFHSADMSIHPRSGVAARWLCETIMAAANAGLLSPY